jgi:hydrogenase-4 component H
MGIFSILSRNSTRGARTRRPDDRVAFPGGFRGAIVHDAARCTACQTCAYVCSPGAITFGTANPDHVEWRYFAGQCTFCGRCVEYCPTRCLIFEGAMPPVTGDPALHRTAHQVVYQPCTRCGRPVIPLPLRTLQELYGGSVPEEIAAHRGLCERCRRKAAALRLTGLTGGSDHA